MVYSNQLNLDLGIALWLASDTYDHSEDPYEISVTTLINPLKQTILARRVKAEDAIQDISGFVKSRIGTAIHDAIEITWLDPERRTRALRALGHPEGIIKRIVVNQEPKGNEIPVYVEQRVKKKVGKWTVSGKFDIVFNGEVGDYKSQSIYGFMKANKETIHRKQGSLYRWLNPDKITKNTMKIHNIILDYSAAQSYQDGYPSSATPTTIYNLASYEETDKFVRKQLSELERLMDAPESEMEECTEEDLWMDPPKFKYYKNPEKGKKRSTKNFDNHSDAIQYRAKNGGIGDIDIVYGEVKRCRFCPAFTVCQQKDMYIASGQLKL